MLFSELLAIENNLEPSQIPNAKSQKPRKKREPKAKPNSKNREQSESQEPSQIPKAKS
jgi:hypothetical protein